MEEGKSGGKRGSIREGVNKGGRRMPLFQAGENDFLPEYLVRVSDAELEHEEDIRSEKES